VVLLRELFEKLKEGRASEMKLGFQRNEQNEKTEKERQKPKSKI